MKTPQRRFVVEFKSGRRQPKTKTNSIWGDTDLKALAREVEEKASHLFNSNEATPVSAEMAPAGSLNAASAGEDGGDVGMARAVIPSPNGAETEIPKHAADPPAAVEAAAQVQESQPASQRRTTSTGTLRKRALAQTTAHNSEAGNEDRKPQAGTVDNPISVDELAALDADNKRLKRLLAEQLRAQNLWLKKMLERFDAD
ncbi:hypothetical protein [Sinorhizobium meliloti]|uniref:hypothetical protein n=1 Tax=Rhizobium meliloti TaxID=382 RepID=UPI000B49E523|nr:hypothetical protein [Sinorhizobium meliloti]ASQ15073.1 hypothetical protein CDO22_34825 [Sinorhizobium meliloti]MQU88353.1 hypothetical protein [Sinorhizobium meliloti]